MKKIMVVGSVIFMLLLSNVSFAAFSDVSGETPYKTAIEWMQKNTVIRGYDDGTFKPDQCVSRAEFLKMLFLTHQNKYEHMIGDFPYTDVPLNSWFTRYVNYFSLQKIVRGYGDGSFKPGQCVNRAEAIKMAVLEFGFLLNSTELNTYDTGADFTDIPAAAWYYQTLYSAIDRNVVGLVHVNHDDPAKTFFYPVAPMSRKEVTELLYRMRAITDNSQKVYNDGMVPNPLTIKIYCLEDPVLTDIGRYQYPVDPQYGHLAFLGELFTADDCKTFDANMIYKIFGVENNDYILGSSLHLKDLEAQKTDVATVLGEIGYQCMDSNAYCLSWTLSEIVPLAEILRLKPYAGVIQDNECVQCG